MARIRGFSKEQYLEVRKLRRAGVTWEGIRGYMANKFNVWQSADALRKLYTRRSTVPTKLLSKKSKENKVIYSILGVANGR